MALPIDLPAPARAVLDFWFGDAPLAQRAEWFRKDPAFDAQIRARFGTLIEAALAGAHADWDAAPAGALARIVVLDQFTRNAFRDTARAFAGDAMALAAARALVARGDDRRLAPLQRVFAYLPFEHAEDRTLQAESLRLFAALTRDAPALAGFEDYARRHAAVIERFGRFPHRNAALGRLSTDGEQRYLQEPGAGF
jgi:uncharacterized protein (DUF924 family)